MISISLPQLIPKILQSQGTEENSKNCDSYNQDKASFDSGARKFHFLGRIYGCSDIKDFLKKAHHEKCCYCESIFGATSYGAVEHFRPKGAVKQGRKKKVTHPGYYWLAYDWNNLLFICERCNINKSCYFPLKDDSARARNHTQSLVREDPLFIHPAFDDPLKHISFHDDAIIFLTEKGEVTIDYLQLNRTDLFERRKQILDYFRTFIETALYFYTDQSNQRMYQDALTLIKKHLSESAEYSAMIKAYFKQFANHPEFSGIQI